MPSDAYDVRFAYDPVGIAVCLFDAAFVRRAVANDGFSAEGRLPWGVTYLAFLRDVLSACKSAWDKERITSTIDALSTTSTRTTTLSPA